MDSENPIILFDVPLKSLRHSPNAEVLWYVPEEKLSSDTRSIFKSPEVEKSTVEVESTVFDKKVGKIRIFGHPEFSSEILSITSGDEIIAELFK